MSSPLSAIDTIVYDAIRQCTPVLEVVAAARIVMPDRAVDVRMQLEDMPHLGNRVFVVPDESETDFEDSSSSVGFRRRYRVGYAVGSLRLEQARDIEWAITRAMCNLSLRLNPFGDEALDDAPSAPLKIETVRVLGSDPERDPPADPEEWRDVCNIEVIARAAIREVRYVQ